MSLGLHARESDAPFAEYVPFETGSSHLSVLSPDGKSFFTKKEKTVIQWRIFPFEKMKVINISENRITQNIFITKDQKKMILQSYGGLSLWDLETKQMIKDITVDIYTAVMHGSELISMDGITITKWDSTTLKKISESQLSSDIPYHYGPCYSSPSLLNDEVSNKFVVVTNACIFFIDGRTLENIKTLQRTKRYLYTSIDHKFLYIHIGENQPIKVDIQTGKLTNLTKNWIEEHKKQLVFYEKGLIYRPHSSFGSLSLVKKGSYRFFNNRTNKPIAKLYQFKDQEGVVMDYDGYFDTSSEGKKHLRMRSYSGDYIPIDDATYKKYHRKNILKINVE